MNRQEIYNKVRDHLLKQNAKSSKPIGRNSNLCLYRSEDGKKCAIGCLIPDELYDPKMENLASNQMLEQFPSIKAHLAVITPEDYDFLADLQTIHDSHSRTVWADSLRKFAIEMGLQP